jgi:hypothetical protein
MPQFQGIANPRDDIVNGHCWDRWIRCNAARRCIRSSGGFPLPIRRTKDLWPAGCIHTHSSQTLITSMQYAEFDGVLTLRHQTSRTLSLMFNTLSLFRWAKHRNTARTLKRPRRVFPFAVRRTNDIGPPGECALRQLETCPPYGWSTQCHIGAALWSGTRFQLAVSEAEFAISLLGIETPTNTRRPGVI